MAVVEEKFWQGWQGIRNLIRAMGGALVLFGIIGLANEAQLSKWWLVGVGVGIVLLFSIFGRPKKTKRLSSPRRTRSRRR